MVTPQALVRPPRDVPVCLAGAVVVPVCLAGAVVVPTSAVSNNTRVVVERQTGGCCFYTFPQAAATASNSANTELRKFSLDDGRTILSQGFACYMFVTPSSDSGEQ